MQGSKRALYCEMDSVRTNGVDMSAVIQQLHGRIHFVVKTLRPSQVPMSEVTEACILSMPTKFVREHGDIKSQEHVLLQCGSTQRPWKVLLKVNNNPGRDVPGVKLGRGWRDFATNLGLVVGDSLVFALKEMPAFEVYAFRGVATSDPSTYSDLSRESVTEDRVASSDPPQHVSTSVHRHLAERGGLVSSEEDMAVGLDAKKKVAEEGSVIASGYHFDFQNLSYIKLHHLESENVQIMSSLQSGTNLPLPAANHQVFVMPSKELTRSQNALPSFIQQLVVSNVQDSAGNTSGACLDIPQSFLKAHNTQLQAHVKLQGIREESPSCIVTCSDDNTFHGGEPSSSSPLSLGWGNFVKDHGLQASQELVFTLVADSFFIVREVSKIVVFTA